MFLKLRRCLLYFVLCLNVLRFLFNNFLKKTLHFEKIVALHPTMEEHLRGEPARDGRGLVTASVGLFGVARQGRNPRTARPLAALLSGFVRWRLNGDAAKGND